jgi:ectoine hydroxylase-related dioxygenase (phytanoyl-CoA dioxygenase family)
MTTLHLPSNLAEEFDRNGFVRIDQVFTPAEMDEIDAAAERLYALWPQAHSQLTPDSASATLNGSRFTFAPGTTNVRHVSMCGNAEPVLLKYGRDPRLLAIASALLGSNEMDQLINQMHYKKPGSGVAFDWHQDSQHRGADKNGFVDVNGRGSYVQIALAIDAATPENGPLQFIPGSNKLGHLGAAVASKIDASTAVAPLLKRGDVAAFGPYTVHGSQANMSKHSRRVFINGFAYPGANQKDYILPHSGERLVYRA